MSKHDELSEMAVRVKQLLGQDAFSLADNKGTTLQSALATMFRPYLYAAVLGGQTAETQKDHDMRKRDWYISMSIYRLTESGQFRYTVCETEGREMTETAPSYGIMDVVQGLDGAARLVTGFTTELNMPAERFGLAAMTKAFHNMRPALSHNNGIARMRRKSHDGTWVLNLDIFRADRAPEYRPKRKITMPNEKTYESNDSSTPAEYTD